MVLFGALDEKDEHHRASVANMRKLSSNDENEYWVASFALFEFGVAMKSRGISFDERMETYSSLVKDYPAISERTLNVGPGTLFLAAQLERDKGMDYFDAGAASESLQMGGVVVSTDRVFDSVPNLKRIW